MDLNHGPTFDFAGGTVVHISSGVCALVCALYLGKRADYPFPTLKSKYNKAGINRGHTFHWEEAMQAGVLTSDDIRRLTELRMIRNTQVHSSNIDRKEVEHAVHLAETLLSALDEERVDGPP